MFGLALRGIRFYWRTHLGVLAGAVLASAVLTGALLVGDSVDHSLSTFANLRLAHIDFAMNTQTQFFQESLGDALAEEIGVNFASVLQLRGMAIYQGDTANDREQINQVQVLGVDAQF